MFTISPRTVAVIDITVACIAIGTLGIIGYVRYNPLPPKHMWLPPNFDADGNDLNLTNPPAVGRYLIENVEVVERSEVVEKLELIEKLEKLELIELIEKLEKPPREAPTQFV